MTKSSRVWNPSTALNKSANGYVKAFAQTVAKSRFSPMPIARVWSNAEGLTNAD